MRRLARTLLSTALFALPVLASATEFSGIPAAASDPARPSAPFGGATVSLLGQLRLSAGLRYWYSTERINFAFANGLPGYGNPTSTLDWTGLTAHTGEGFFRLEHATTGLLLKGIVGGGGITSGDLVDRDFFSGQRSFSATRSPVSGASISYGQVDLGIRFSPAPRSIPGLEVSPFVGFHHWNDNPVARGATCEASDIPRSDCARSATGILVPLSTKSLGYAVRWEALRLGVGASGPIPSMAGLSVSAEVAFVPYARFAVDDSHYLRADLGQPPNVLSRGTGRGVEAEVMLSYAVTEQFQLAVGGRYWGLFGDGDVRARMIIPRSRVTRYDQQRYGLLLQARYSF